MRRNGEVEGAERELGMERAEEEIEFLYLFLTN